MKAEHSVVPKSSSITTSTFDRSSNGILGYTAILYRTLYSLPAHALRKRELKEPQRHAMEWGPVGYAGPGVVVEQVSEVR